MSQARRKSDARKVRKKILRAMKKPSMVVAQHGRRYHELLDRCRELTSWSRPRAECVPARIDNVLLKLPVAIKQAHERIIGGRKVRSGDKLPSLYEEDIHVIVRGKADAEVEFGNGLYLVEQEDGLIVDWRLFKDHPPADSLCVQESVARVMETLGRVKSYTADRGFWSKHSGEVLDNARVLNGICPKDPVSLREKLCDTVFKTLRKRRAQTEGRIGILKNVFTGNPLTCHGFTHRDKAVAWCILAHNLWVLGRKAREGRRKKEMHYSYAPAARESRLAEWNPWGKLRPETGKCPYTTR